MNFSLLRYEQHIDLPQVGIEGQEKIFNSKVLIVGMGGLGCPIACYLTAAGVGTLGFIDADVIEKSNLQRQIIYSNDDVGRLKAEVAKEKLDRSLDNQSIRAFTFFLDESNANDIISQFDVVIDATDNHITRLLINKICLKQSKPWIYGALYHFEGQIMIFNNFDNSPCFTCLFPDLDENSSLPTCKSAGVLSTIPGIIGAMQATEALKQILDLPGEVNKAKLIIFNALTYELSSLEVKRNTECRVCNHGTCFKEQSL